MALNQGSLIMYRLVESWTLTANILLLFVLMVLVNVFWFWLGFKLFKEEDQKLTIVRPELTIEEALIYLGSCNVDKEIKGLRTIPKVYKRALPSEKDAFFKHLFRLFEEEVVYRRLNSKDDSFDYDNEYFICDHLCHAALVFVKQKHHRLALKGLNPEDFILMFPQSDDGLHLLSWLYFYNKPSVEEALECVRVVLKECKEESEEYWTLLATVAFECGPVARLLLDHDMITKRLLYWESFESKLTTVHRKRRHKECMRFVFNVLRSIIQEDTLSIDEPLNSYAPVTSPLDIKSRIQYIWFLDQDPILKEYLAMVETSELSPKRVKKWARMSSAMLTSSCIIHGIREIGNHFDSLLSKDCNT